MTKKVGVNMLFDSGFFPAGFKPSGEIIKTGISFGGRKNVPVFFFILFKPQQHVAGKPHLPFHMPFRDGGRKPNTFSIK